MYAEYVSSNSFRTIGDETAEFIPTRRLQLDCGVDGLRVTTILSSTYESTSTLITVTENVITTNLTAVLYSVVKPGEFGNLPNHNHDSSEGQGGELAIQLSFTDLIDAPSTYSGTGDLYLKSTGSGTEWVEMPAQLVYGAALPAFPDSITDFYIDTTNNCIYGSDGGDASSLNWHARSVIFDFPDRLEVSYAYCAVRSIEFYVDYTLIPLSADDITCYATTSFSSSYIASNAFVTSLSKTGTYTGNEWLTATAGEQRLICVFNDVKYFNKIVINNSHDVGIIKGGLVTVNISVSDNIETEVDPAVTISGCTNIFSSTINPHISSNIVDDQILDIASPPTTTSGWVKVLNAAYTFLGLSDTPTTYSDGQYLRTTSSGIEAIDGIILKAPNDSEWLIRVTSSGTLYTVEV